MRFDTQKKRARVREQMIKELKFQGYYLVSSEIVDKWIANGSSVFNPIVKESLRVAKISCLYHLKKS